MKLTERYAFEPSRQFEVQEATERQLNANEYGSGQLEVMQREVDSIKSYLGRLTALLVATGHFDAQAIEVLLPSFEIHKEAADE